MNNIRRMKTKIENIFIKRCGKRTTITKLKVQERNLAEAAGGDKEDHIVTGKQIGRAHV